MKPDIAKILKIVFSLEGVKNFLTVQGEDGSLSLNQIFGSIIQLIIFVILIATIGFFLL